MTEQLSPPLIGDEHGKYRIVVLGNCGAGKTTLATALANKLGLKYCSLDRLNWNPGWQETPTAELRALLQEIIDHSPQGWIVDGNYTGKVGPMVQDQATDIIWLDPPLLLYFPRLSLRTIKRWWGLEELCSPGCEETFKNIFFSKESILVFCLLHHFVVRRRYKEMMSRIGIGIGPNPRINRMQRIGGWGVALESWLQKVDIMARKKP